MGCLPAAMGGIPEAPHDFPLNMPCPSTALPSWGEAQAYAGPDSPLPMIPAPPFVAGSVEAVELRKEVNDKLDMIEKNMKLEKEAVSRGIHIPPYIEAADHETKQFTEEAARLLKPEQILLPWDSSKVDNRMKQLGISGLGSGKTGTSVPFMGSADGPNFDAAAAHKLAVSDGGSGGSEGSGGKKLDVYKRGFIYRGGRRRKKRKKKRRGGTKKIWRRRVKSKTKKRRQHAKQQILRDRRHPTRITQMQAKARDQAGRHHNWLVSLGVRKNFTFKSPKKMKFTKGKIDSLTKLLNKMSINKTKRRRSIKKTIQNKEKIIILAVCDDELKWKFSFYLI